MGPTSMMVVLIVLIAVIGRVMQERYRAMARLHAEEIVRNSAGDGGRSQDEVRQLKERVAVLERLITDNHGRADLERQIEQLRDR
ncbi:hypothetical protein [Sphingomonas sp. BK235]|jgi:uncharacterized membrane protein YcjF (UPF0283 family)|uniref:hypothetical protein n=1 Tax=Sphingomonas sp. BK235 TaxID=2512131 RepID=UPI0010EF77E2|nr:hypothetical protein [Sphingomonas sp. BK235]TCP36882.1 hypothetical protein EV292_101385 [Sphingomonas sp. BK235]